MTEPRQTIVFGRILADVEQQKRLTELFSHPGFALLKEIIGAHAVEQQVRAMNSGLYSENNEIAKLDTDSAMKKASAYSQALDLLSDFESRPDEWFTAKLDPRP